MYSSYIFELYEESQSVKYCGSALPPVFYSYGSEAQVNFVTDEIISMTGFKLNVSVAGEVPFHFCNI